MNEREFADLLAEILYVSEFEEIDRIERFDEAGLLTLDQGLVVHLHDGSQFHLAVQQVELPYEAR